MNSITLNELIGDFLERIDAGQQPDPHEFVAAWPQHRQAFFEFLEQSGWSTQPAAVEVSSGGQSAREADSPVLVRRVVGGYRIGRQIGRGGMSRVFEAQRIGDGVQVALKVMATGIIADRTVEQRFRREAQAIQSLQHPHIVPLLDVGCDEGVSYLALKLVRGWTLGRLIQVLRCSDDGALEQDEHRSSQVLSVLGQACCEPRTTLTKTEHALWLAEKLADIADALQAAHDQGIVHRDVKPSNLMLAQDGRFWLTDFGLASVGDAHTALTHTGQVVGTPFYMSPEQARGDSQAVGPRSDVYSLGATLYELVTLARPYRGDRFKVLVELSAGRLQHPSKAWPEIPQSLEAIILKAMAFQPADRYASAREMAHDLRRFAAGQSTRAKVPGITDKVIKWMAAHPQQTVMIAASLLVAGLLIVSVQHVMGLRLSALNQELEDHNQTIEQTNERLVQSNLALDHTQQRLRRQLYVADVAAAYRAFAQRDIDAVHQLLERHAPGHADAGLGLDLRGFEWWLLHRLTQPPAQQVLVQHAGEARELALLPGGRGGLSVGHDGVVHRWNSAFETEVGRFVMGEQLDSIAISRDGTQMLLGQNVAEGLNPVIVCSAATGEVLNTLTPHEYSVESAAFSRSGKWLATAGRYHDVLLHDSEGKLQARLQTGSRNEALAFSADEGYLYTIFRDDQDGHRRQYLARCKLPSLEVQQEIPLSIRPNVFCLSEDGRWLVAANQDALTLIDPTSGQCLMDPTEVRGRIRCVALSSDGSGLAAGCDNGLIHIWGQLALVQPQQAEPSQVVNTGPDGVTSIAFDADGDLLATLKDGSVRKWLLASRNSASVQFGVPLAAIDVAKGEAGTVVGRHANGAVYRVDLEGHSCQWLADGGAAPLQELAVSRSGQQVMVANTQELVALNAIENRVAWRVPSAAGKTPCSWLRFLSEDTAFAALYADQLNIHDASDGRLKHQLALAGEGADRLCVAPGGDRLLVNGRKWLRCFETNTWTMIHEQQVQFSEHTLAEYSPSGRWIVVGHQDGTLELLDGRDLTRQTLLRGHRSGIDDCEFLPDEQALVTISSGGSLRFWDLLSGRGLGVLHLDEPASGYRVHFAAELQSLFVFHPQQPIRVLSGR